MTEDHQRIWRLALGEERAHAAPERTADESDALGIAKRVARLTKILKLERVFPARPRSACPERHRSGLDPERPKRRRELFHDRLVRGPAVTGSKDRRAFDHA